MSSRLRGYAAPAVLLLITWLSLTSLLVVVGIGVEHSSTVAAFDRHVTSTVVAQRTPALNAAMKALTWLGSWVVLVATGIIVVVLALRGRILWLAVGLAVAAWAGEAAAVALAKRIVHRQRPPERIWLMTAHGWSWPSGHTATAVLIFTVLAVVVSQTLSSRGIRIVTWIIAILGSAGVAFSRVELGVHWTTDVVASFVFVSMWLLTVTLVAKRTRRREQPGFREADVLPTAASFDALNSASTKRVGTPEARSVRPAGQVISYER